jgi:hypothetical protein
MLRVGHNHYHAAASGQTMHWLRKRRLEELLARRVAAEVRKHYGRDGQNYVRAKMIETAKSDNLRLNRLWGRVRAILRSDPSE